MKFVLICQAMSCDISFLRNHFFRNFISIFYIRSWTLEMCSYLVLVPDISFLKIISQNHFSKSLLKIFAKNFQQRKKLGKRLWLDRESNPGQPRKKLPLYQLHHDSLISIEGEFLYLNSMRACSSSSLEEYRILAWRSHARIKFFARRAKNFFYQHISWKKN